MSVIESEIIEQYEQQNLALSAELEELKSQILEKTDAVERLEHSLEKRERAVSLEALYWKICWLQFLIIALGFWVQVLSSVQFNPLAVDPASVSVAVQGTMLAFSNVLLGGMIKFFNHVLEQRELGEV